MTECTYCPKTKDPKDSTFNEDWAAHLFRWHLALFKDHDRVILSVLFKGIRYLWFMKYYQL